MCIKDGRENEMNKDQWYVLFTGFILIFHLIVFIFYPSLSFGFVIFSAIVMWGSMTIIYGLYLLYIDRIEKEEGGA